MIATLTQPTTSSESPVTAVLISKKSRPVSRAELATIVTPEPRGSRHRPVPHAVLVDTLDGVLREAGLTVQQERYAVGRAGSRLFGVIQVQPSESNALHGLRREGQSFAIGLRSGNAGDVSIKVAAGLRVTVCDNMVLAGTLWSWPGPSSP